MIYLTPNPAKHDKKGKRKEVKKDVENLFTETKKTIHQQLQLLEDRAEDENISVEELCKISDSISNLISVSSHLYELL